VEWLKVKALSSNPSSALPTKEKIALGWALEAHAYNPSYSGSRDQEDHGSKPVLANSSREPILIIPITKRAGRVAQGESPEFKSQYQKTKKDCS
jgi:hypothetical protein